MPPPQPDIGDDLSQTGLWAADPAQLHAAGWVSERFAETVYLGMPATLGWNSGGQKQQVRGLITDMQAGDHPLRPGEFGIVLQVSAQPNTDSAPHRLHPGAPVNPDPTLCSDPHDPIDARI